MRRLQTIILLMMTGVVLSPSQADELDVDGVTEQHQMIQMRDGKRLSASMYLPEGDGPWPESFEQCDAGLRANSTRKFASGLANSGYVVALVISVELIFPKGFGLARAVY